MRRIDIKDQNDFKLLEQLKGLDTIFLKIMTKNMPRELMAFDLSQFNGTIVISFLYPQFHKLKVKTDSWDNYYIFKNVGKTLISFQENVLFSIKYDQRENRYAVKDVQEKLRKIQVEAIPCDKIIRIKKKEHLARLNDLVDGSIYVDVNTDIENELIPAISLKNFTGKLCIDGHGHVISHCTIENGENGGLITDINSQGSLVINNFHIENCRFLGKCNYSGAFLGSRDMKKGYASSPALVVIVNCSVKKCKFTRAKYNGAFIGKWDEFISVLNCYHSDNVTRKGNIKFSSASDGSFGLISSFTTKNELNDELQLIRKN